MRLTTDIHVNQHGLVTQIGWQALDDEGDLVALGTHYLAQRDWSRDFEQQLRQALWFCVENVERNGVQLSLFEQF